MARIPRPSTSQIRCSMGLRSGERAESTECTLSGGLLLRGKCDRLHLSAVASCNVNKYVNELVVDCF